MPVNGRPVRRTRRRVFTLLLTGLVLVGIGAAATAAAWVDQTQYAATVRSSSFDFQVRTSATGEWQDVGLPGDPDTDTAGNEIILPGISDALPGTSYAVPFFLCNAGDVDGRIADEEVTVDGPLVEFAGVNVETFRVGTVLPANSCNDDDQIRAYVQLTTKADWGTGRSGTTDVIRIRIICESE